MRADDLKKLLKRQPFEPIRLGLSDGRSVLIRHPDRVVVSDWHIYIGLATMERSGPMATPRTAEAQMRDWMLVNILHVATAESANGARSARRRRRPKPKQ